MSWSASTPKPIDPGHINPDAFSLSPSELVDGPRKQFEAAVEAAKVVAATVKAPVRVSLYGHSNEEQATGAAEGTTVSVSQASIS